MPKVSFNIASEASYVYILSRQKFMKSTQKSFSKPEACGQTVIPDRSLLIGQKVMKSAKIQKFKCDILSRQKFIENAKIVSILAISWNPEVCVKQYYQTGHFQ